MKNIISVEQRGFIQGRNIKNCICVTSEAINQLHNKTFAGNLAFKVDMAKVFDTLEWRFLLKVLKSFGFNDRFCSWINTILHSATLSILVNGKQNGYFHCKRGVRQGDPLSPLIFCIVEDVLSRNISKLVEQGKLELIKGTRYVQVPSHSLYADDIMIFCKGKISSIQALMQLFQSYVAASGQFINPLKSTVYYGFISPARIDHITNLIGFNKGCLPFTYLGVPIFKGKPKKIHLQPIADKIKSKLSAWKASLLSLAGRVLVKSVIQAMLIHSISMYSWPSTLLKEIESWCRNFIWSSVCSKRKLVTVSWKKSCKPLSEGGLGIRSLTLINEAANLKLGWELRNSNEAWVVLLRSKVLRGKRTITHHISSSLWSSIKSENNSIDANSIWLIGTGKDIYFWLDPWCGESFVSVLDIPVHLHHNLKARVSDFINDFNWNFPLEVENVFPILKQLALKVTLPINVRKDTLLWKPSNTGVLTFKKAFLFKQGTGQNSHWAKDLWSPDIPPSQSFLVWRIMHNKLPSDENLSLRGYFPSACSVYKSCSETTNHLFFECIFAFKLWSCIASMLRTSVITSMDDFWVVLNKQWSPQ